MLTLKVVLTNGGPATFLVLGLVLPFGVSAQEPIEHPFIEPKDIKPATCLTCHPEKMAARFVHAAVKSGCANCHHIVSGKNKTTITLFANGGDLCARCHEVERQAVLHGPYKKGECLVCHNPHASEFRSQTRAAVNSLCLECHASRTSMGKSVILFNFETISKTDFEAIPKIRLDPTRHFGHPQSAHPVAEVADPLREGETMSCLSCHEPHVSTLPNLLVSVKEGGSNCEACHRAIDKQKEGKPNSQPPQPP